jgi:2-polyprenyl-3-methyl-5-hydroxy-6-metoxy-1,4-benzoquinol methylase
MAPPAGFQSRFDFVICAGVMEHIPPPIQVAFANLRSLLRPGGLLLFSVPYSCDDKTVEYFPDCIGLKSWETAPSAIS